MHIRAFSTTLLGYSMEWDLYSPAPRRSCTALPPCPHSRIHSPGLAQLTTHKWLGPHCTGIVQESISGPTTNKGGARAYIDLFKVRIKSGASPLVFLLQLS